MRTTQALRACSIAAVSLIELLVALAVIAVLSSLLGVSSSQAKTKMREAQCLSNLHQIALGMMNYAASHQGRLPIEEVLRSGTPFDGWLALRESLAAPSAFHCPADRRFTPASRFDDLTEADISYTIGIQSRGDCPTMLLSTDGYLSDGCFLAESLEDAHWETKLSLAHGVGRGNGLFVDGSARPLNGPRLRQALEEALRVADSPYIEFLLPGERPLASF